MERARGARPTADEADAPDAHVVLAHAYAVLARIATSLGRPDEAADHAARAADQDERRAGWWRSDVARP